MRSRIPAMLFFAVALLGVAPAFAATLPDPQLDAPLAKNTGSQSIVLSGGCFWGVQAVFQHVKGVQTALSGYTGGDSKTADYESVSTGTTGHAESVQVTYDPAQITLGQLLKVYFEVAHDPTELNRQGPDSGTQYRSSIFFANAEQAHIAAAYVKQLTAANVFDRPIVTQIVPLIGFYKAEDYHQDYFKLHPTNSYIMANDVPKVNALKTQLPSLYRDN